MKISINREIQQNMIFINEKNCTEIAKIQSARLARMVATLSLRRDVKAMCIHKNIITVRL
jgi:hypothetical protein